MFRHRLVDQNDRGRTCRVIRIEVSAAKDRNFENAEVPGRDCHPFGVPGGTGIIRRIGKGQTHPAGIGRAEGRRGTFHTGDAHKLLLRIADHARYARGSVIMTAVDRHGDGHNMMAIEARVNVAQGNKRANQQRCANE